MDDDDGLIKIVSILKRNHTIPKYQREYAWTEHQVLELWSDLTEYYTNQTKDSKYIFGQFIIYHSTYDGTNYVIDGQQRLTTSYILLAVARKIVGMIYPDKNKHTQSVCQFLKSLEEHLFEYNEKDECLNPLLSVHEAYKKEFNEILNSGVESLDPKSDSHYVAAYNTLFKKMYCFALESGFDLECDYDDPNLIEGSRSCFDRIKKIVDCFLSFTVVQITVNQLADAYRIYDSINTRGIKLESTDLVKNYFFTRCYSNDLELQSDDYSLEYKWNSIVSYVRNDFSRFFRYVLIAKYGTTRDEEIMTTVKTQIKKTDDVKKIIEEMDYASEIYLLVTKKKS